MSTPDAAATQRASSSTVVLATASDDRYAIGVAVMVRSALAHLASDRRLELWVLGGIGEDTRRRLVASWPADRLDVHWVDAGSERLAALPTLHYITAETYLRLLLPELLPPTASKVLYVDADVLVRRDLGELWDRELAHPVAGVADQKLPTHGNAFDRLDDMGLRADTPYVNGGVLALDIERWRADDLGDRVITYLRENPEFIHLLDQDALNAVLDGDVEVLDPRWNVQAPLFELGATLPARAALVDRADVCPWIVHFTGFDKPWTWECQHPFRDEWRRFLDVTDWAGERPAPPPMWRRAARRATDGPRGRRVVKAARRHLHH